MVLITIVTGANLNQLTSLGGPHIVAISNDHFSLADDLTLTMIYGSHGFRYVKVSEVFWKFLKNIWRLPIHGGTPSHHPFY